MHRLEIRAHKRSRHLQEEYDESGEIIGYALTTISGPVHAPNAFESKIIRQMRAKFHVDEITLRKHKHFRQLLGCALKVHNCSSKDPLERCYRPTMRRISRFELKPWSDEYKTKFCDTWVNLGFNTIESAEIAYNNLAMKRGWVLHAERAKEVRTTA